MPKKKIGIKYCGGCNPGYERVEMVQRVQSQFRNRFHFLRSDEPDVDMLILVNGCFRTCATRDLNSVKIPHRSITGENDFEDLMGWLSVLDDR